MGIRLTIPGWTPKDAYIWWDASDASTITMQTGVSQISDKGSIGANMVQTSAAAQPEYDSVKQNGLSTISFNGSSHYLTTNPFDFPSAQPNYYLAVAFKPITSTNKRDSIISRYDEWQISSGTAPAWHGKISGNTFDSSNSIGIPQVLGFISDTTNGILTGYKNGQQVFEDTGFTGYSPIDIVLDMGVGKSDNHFLNADFYELIIVPIEDREPTDNYLKHKWNI